MNNKVVPIRKETLPPMSEGMTEHMFTFYDTTGEKFSLTVWAYSEWDARDRFVRASAGYFDGIVYETVKA